MNELEYLQKIDKKLDRVLQTKKTWLSVKDLSEYISISESKIRQMLADKRIPYSKIDGSIRFSRKQIDIWVFTRSLTQSQEQVDRIKLYLE